MGPDQLGSRNTADLDLLCLKQDLSRLSIKMFIN